MFFLKVHRKIQIIMKLIQFIFLLVIGTTTFGQQFEIPAEQFPFYSIIEWKGMGSILLNRDPSGNMKKVNMTLVGGSQTTSIWQQSFNPNGKDFYYISSENARYVYFLDDLNPQAGKVSLHQLSSAGNIKSTSIALSPAIKKLGAYDMPQMEVMDIVTTDKALVHVFRYHDVKEKKYTEIATFITHHNLLVYAAILGEVPEAAVKDGTMGQWHYVGFNGDNIYFAARDKTNKKNGWAVQNFTSKGALTEGLTIQAPEDKFEVTERIGIGSNGRVYLNNSADADAGALIHHNGQFYALGSVLSGTSRSLILKQQVEGKWKTLSSASYTETSKKAVQIGTYPLNEGIGCKVNNMLIFLPYQGSTAANAVPFSPKFNTNPSRWIIADKKELFAVSLAEGNLFFDPAQLNKAGNVKFELIKK
jgi:hypothetical protein